MNIAEQLAISLITIIRPMKTAFRLGVVIEEFFWDSDLFGFTIPKSRRLYLHAFIHVYSNLSMKKI